MIRFVLMIVLMAGFAGCATERPLRASGPAAVAVLAELPAATVPTEQPPRMDEVVAQYERVLGTAPGAVNDDALVRRLADLKMNTVEAAESDAIDTASQRATIALYESLLESPDAADPDQVMYRLARAYEVVGDRATAQRYLDRLIAEFPYSRYATEAHFRRAESNFSADRFAEAADDYRFVVEQGQESLYWQNATYMLAWTQLKLGRPAESLTGFLAVLPQTLVADEVRDRAAQELLDDVLRGAVLALNDLDNARTLSKAMDQLARPQWQYRVFERLAQELAVKGRILDSVAALAAYVERNPMDWRAAVFDERAIDTLERADFPAEAARHKAQFVARYGIKGDYWKVYANDARNDYRGTLDRYLTELVAVAHADAQMTHRPKDFVRAASLYEELIESFPDDARVPGHLFLLGEAYTDAKMPELAIASFQRVVHDYPDFERAGEAAYAVVLGLTALRDAAPVEARGELSWRTIEAEIEFFDSFPTHPQAGKALTAAAVAAYELDDFALAIALADRVIADARMTTGLRRTALLVAGQARYELGRFEAAEKAFLAYLAIEPDTSAAAHDVRTKLLAAIFKQAEAAERSGDAGSAVAHFLRMADIDAAADLTVRGLYDAVAIRESESAWPEAARLLIDLRDRYPNHPLSADSTRRLADLYQQASQPLLAAEQLRRLAQEDSDANVRRQALYRAAELYFDRDARAALACFGEYADAYPVPVDVALEAMHRAATLSQEAGDGTTYRAWLKRIVAAAGAVVDPDDRARYLAAEAQLVLADDARDAFLAIGLDTPMAASLREKQAAMKIAVSAYERVAAHGVTQFATASTYNVAEIYAALADSIVRSNRPDGLSELELAQYEVLLEEQAVPFEERAIELHELNAKRSSMGVYDEWVQLSFDRLRVLFPARFDKTEVTFGAVHSIR